MTKNPPEDSTDKLLSALGSYMRSQKAAGTNVASTSDTDPENGLPENVRVTLKQASRGARQGMYDAALRGMETAQPVVEKPKKSWLQWLLPSLAFPVMATAGLLLWAGEQAAPLPAYSMQAHGTATMRGPGDAEPFVVRPNTTVEVVLRPATAVAQKVSVKLFWRNGLALVPWTASTEISSSGAVRARGTVTVPWFTTLTQGELIAFVAAEGIETPSIRQIDNPPRGVQVLRHPVTWQP